MSERYARLNIEGAEIVGSMDPTLDVPAPANVRQARELAPLRDDPHETDIGDETLIASVSRVGSIDPTTDTALRFFAAPETPPTSCAFLSPRGQERATGFEPATFR